MTDKEPSIIEGLNQIATALVKIFFGSIILYAVWKIVF